MINIDSKNIKLQIWDTVRDFLFCLSENLRWIGLVFGTKNTMIALFGQSGLC